MSASMKITGLSDVAALLRKLPKRTGRKIMQDALRKGAKPMVKAARDKVPVDQKDLKKSIGVVRNKKESTPEREVISITTRKGGNFKSAHAHLIEFGVDPFGPAGKDALVFKTKDGGIVRVQQVKGQKKQPYMTPAFSQTKRMMIKLIGLEFLKAFDKEASKLAKG